VELGNVVELGHVFGAHPDLPGQALEVLVYQLRCTSLLYLNELPVVAFPYHPLLLIVVDLGYVLAVHIILSTNPVHLIPSH
jgi:hypothetical protein